MDMGWGGTVDWTPEAKVRIAQATTDISRRLEVDEETADRLWEAMSDVYELMASQGLSAYPGGEQSVRGIPEALEFIRCRSTRCPKRRIDARVNIRRQPRSCIRGNGAATSALRIPCKATMRRRGPPLLLLRELRKRGRCPATRLLVVPGESSCRSVMRSRIHAEAEALTHLSSDLV
jgi:hypothetical protein